MPNVVKITAAGKKDLQEELKALKARRPEIAEKIALARSYGDLSENEDYSAARSEQNTVEGRIQEIEDILLHAKIIENKKTDKVALGSTVTLDVEGKSRSYILVGATEADPLNGKISDVSPIGKQLMGQKVGFEGELPNKKKFSIKTIE
ncbi:transcription elongation factor GreA [Candidatus Saccharibacteria bacterium]|jgi:transcription elongation factor GreA|nr:transcription elongation factor GreA [Candidatus Saccharibacteria bacterium]